MTHQFPFFFVRFEFQLERLDGKRKQKTLRLGWGVSQMHCAVITVSRWAWGLQRETPLCDEVRGLASATGHDAGSASVNIRGKGVRFGHLDGTSER
jgi:hypothetical protein